MARFKTANRNQQYLLPLNMKDWLPKDHFVWFLLDVIEHSDLEPFYEGYSTELRGEEAYSPEIMVPLLIYSYIQGIRSSRKIEQLCERDVAYRIVACNQVPDHSTICRFRTNHRKAIKELFAEVLCLCNEAGMGEVGTISIDGTKMKAQASLKANRTYKRICEEIEEILTEAEEVDRQEDEEFGEDRRGDELPDELADRSKRLERLKECKEQIEREAEEKAEEKREQIRQREKEEKETGRKKPGRKPDPPDPTPDEEARANPSDPESRIMKDDRGYLQGYNLQAAVSEDQIILSAEATNAQNDRKQLRPMVEKTNKQMEEGGIKEDVEYAALDNGYWSEEAIKEEEAQQEFTFLVATANTKKMREKQKEAEPPEEEPPEDASFQEIMDYRLTTEQGESAYGKRKTTVEPVFGQIKERLRCDRFLLRGKEKVDTEWKLMCMGHNLLKLWKNSQRN